MKQTSNCSGYMYLIMIALVICFNTSSFSQIRIAISKTSASYENWLKTADTSVIPVNMYSLSIDSALQLLTSCNALLLTGGEDVDPVNYGKSNELNKCEDIDRYRRDKIFDRKENNTNGHVLGAIGRNNRWDATLHPVGKPGINH